MSETSIADEADWVCVAQSFANALPARAEELDRSAYRRRAVRVAGDIGLTTLLGPARHGGAEQPWRVAHQVVRTIAGADAEVAELLGRHYVWYWIAEFIGTDEKIDHIGEVSTRARWFYGGAADPRAADLTVTDAGDAMLFDGRIAPAVGSDVSTMTILQGVRSDTAIPISALSYTSHPGIVVPTAADDGWIDVTAAAIPWTGALGHVNKRFEPRPYNDLLVPTLDLVLLDLALAARGTVADNSATAAAVRLADRGIEGAQHLHDNRRTVTVADVLTQTARVSELAATVRALPQSLQAHEGEHR